MVRGKRLFIATCASCHVGGGTRTNQNVGLAIEELSGATPNRASIEGLVDYLNNPTTYDGLKAMTSQPKMSLVGQSCPDIVSQSWFLFCTDFSICVFRSFASMLWMPWWFYCSVINARRTSLKFTPPSRVATFGPRCAP